MTKYTNIFFSAMLVCVLVRSAIFAAEKKPLPLEGGYAVVVSQTTATTDGWSDVLKTLREKYDAQVMLHPPGKVEEALSELQEKHPRYVCFLAQPNEVRGDFVVRVHQLTRKLDDDPWTDCIWAILTGYEAADAMRIVKEEPLEIRRVLAGTPMRLECADSGVWFSELKKNEKWTKESGKAPVAVTGPDDTTTAIIAELVEGKAQLFVTSGHATQKDWMIGFSYRNGFFVSQPDGKLAGKDITGKLHTFSSDEPRVHLGVGNCLIGDISDADNCMALGLIHSAGVRQMVGYTVPSWYGYMGWGMLDYFYLQPGRYTAAEAFFANQQALLHRLETAQQMNLSQQDVSGLLYDRDTVVIYGDPAWNARMAEGQNEWTQILTESREGESITYTITLRKTAYDNTDKNGSQRGGRPFFAFLPVRLAQKGTVEILAGADFKPMIADDFVLIPKFAMEEGKEYTITFRGKMRN